MAVNLGTRGVEAAPQPGRVLPTTPAARTGPTCGAPTARPSRTACKVWCLGNEMDGPWQIGHKTADEYGRLAGRDGQGHAAGRPDHRAGRLRQLQRTPCPRSARGRRPCCRARYDVVDYVSMHAYYEELDGDRDSFLGSAVDMDRFIEDVVATADHVRRRRPAPQADQHLVRRVERLVPAAGSQARRTCELEHGAAADRGRLLRDRRGRRRQPAHHPAAARRPGDASPAWPSWST